MPVDIHVEGAARRGYERVRQPFWVLICRPSTPRGAVFRVKRYLCTQKNTVVPKCMLIFPENRAGQSSIISVGGTATANML